MSDNILQLNEAAIKGELKDLVKNSVEETLNALLDHEADELVKPRGYQGSAARGSGEALRISRILIIKDCMRQVKNAPVPRQRHSNFKLLLIIPQHGRSGKSRAPLGGEASLDLASGGSAT